MLNETCDEYRNIILYKLLEFDSDLKEKMVQLWLFLYSEKIQEWILIICHSF